MSFPVCQLGDDRLVGAGRRRFGSGLDVSRLLHHQNTPAPSKATRITAMATSLNVQRIASRAMRKNIASNITPAIRKIVVKLIKLVGSVQFAVCSINTSG
jgi:hypothetical protein